jgi:hypothetical protein
MAMKFTFSDSHVESVHELREYPYSEYRVILIFLKLGTDNFIFVYGRN